MGSCGKNLPGCSDDIPLNNKEEPDRYYKDLWEACAGPHADIPSRGEKVFYFPQGHAEQVQAYCGNQDGGSNFPVYDVPSKIPCKVASIALKAEDVTDEVVAQITLIPGNEKGLAKWLEEDEVDAIPPKRAMFSFSKTLTPSDTSTHGGFSVPKRCADECFPGLDMSLQPPVQELVAKDLNGHEWHFRHIYRGQPKRHLLTSGWSTFVVAKKLVAGDACVFVRGENGELRVGVRHVTKSSSRSVITGQCMKHGILASAYHAISYDSLFVVFHRPWRYPHFVVSYDQYKRSTAIEHVPGMRFRYDFEGDEFVQKRVAGTIIGVADQDPIRWPNSKWKCLMVRWDGGPNTSSLPHRLSPWEINLISTNAVEDLFRKSLGFAVTTNEDAKGIAKNPLERIPRRQSEVLQGQENIGDAVIDGDRRATQMKHNQRRREILFPIYPDHENASTVTSNYSIDNNDHTSDGHGGPILFGVNLSIVDQDHPSHPGEALSHCYHDNPPKKLCVLGNTTRSCTKVLKYGSALGRSVDVGSFDGYEELIAELDKMFDFHGSLVDESSGWKVTYMDEESDLMLLGDYDWQVFRAGVRKMFIHPKAELDKMKP